VVLVCLAVLPVGVSGPAAADLGVVLAVGLAAAGLLHPAVVAVPGWAEAGAAAGVAAGSLSLPPALPLLCVLVLL